MLLHSSRSLAPAGGGVTPNTASQALAAARWCDHGHTPQMRGVMRGMSSTGSPHAELLEAAQLDDIHAGQVHIAGIVQLNGDLGVALNARDRLNHYVFPWFTSWAPDAGGPQPAKRLKVAARSGICFGSSPMVESAPIMSTMGLAFSDMGPKQPSHGM
jgi:hypothetical protein